MRFSNKNSLAINTNYINTPATPVIHMILQEPPPPGGNSHMKGAGMLVVSLRGVNFKFWSRLGWSAQNTIIFNRSGCTRRNIKKLCIFNSFYLLDSCNQRF